MCLLQITLLDDHYDGEYEEHNEEYMFFSLPKNREDPWRLAKEWTLAWIEELINEEVAARIGYTSLPLFCKKITVYKVKEEYGLALVQCPV
jgi:hypothetical protein